MNSNLYRQSRSPADAFRTGQANGQSNAQYSFMPGTGGNPPGAAYCGAAGGQSDCGPCAPWPCRVKLFGGRKLAVPALGTVTVSIQPVTAIRVHRIMVPSDVASFFTIDSIKIGSNDMIISGGTDGASIPATTLSEVSVDAWVSLDCMNTAQQIVIGVTNIDPALPHDFRITFIGITPNSTGYGE